MAPNIFYAKIALTKLINKGMQKGKPKQDRDWSKEIELVDSSDFHKDRQTELKWYLSRFLRFLQLAFCQSFWSVFILVLFIVTFFASLKWGGLELCLIGWGTYFIFSNLGTRKKGTLSAWSVFNKNFERPIGHEVAHSTSAHRSLKLDNPNLTAKPVEGTEGVDAEDLPVLYFTKIGKFANKECYCGSGQKYKKCCYPLDQKFGPTNQERKEKAD